MLWALPPATPKPSPRGSAHTQSTPGKADKGGNDSKGNDSKKSPTDILGGDNQAKGPTEITAKDEVQFDGQTRMAVFVGSVKVIDPQFTMTTDKLTVWMNKQEDGGGLREAEADGNVIIVHANPNKETAKPNDPGGTPVPTASPSPAASPQQLALSTGRAQKAVYNAKEDAVTLIGWPQVTEGINTHIATEEGTRMVLYRDGRLKTYGASRTIIQDKGGVAKPPTSASQTPNKAQNNVIQ